MGLRDSRRLAPAAYWASWADSLQGLVNGFPEVGRDILRHLQALNATGPRNFQQYQTCLATAEAAWWQCDETGWRDRPSWVTLAAGGRPPEQPTRQELGDCEHGWQFHASCGFERCAFRSLLQILGGGATARRDAATTGKTRLRSCMGAFASTWLTTCPTTDALVLCNSYMLCAIRRRLGIGVLCDGPVPHGHAKMTTNHNARLVTRHTWMVSAWRQVFTEAGGFIPDRNVERMLHRTHLPVPPGDQRRIDFLVPCLNVARGLPLFCDVTILSPITRIGQPRPGTSNRSGKLLDIQ